MSTLAIGRSRGVVWAVLAAFAAFVMPAGLAAGPGAAAGSGSLSGFIFAKDVKTPVAGAVVKVRNVADLKELASGPTDANGMFTITGIPEGRYLLGVTSGKDDFNLDYALYVKAGELGKVSLALGPGGAKTAGGQEAGAAPPKKKSFFTSPAGIILIVAAVGVGLYILISSGDENEPSPIR